MSELVGIFGVQHNPLLYRVLKDPVDDDLIALRDTFAELAERLRSVRPDVVVVIATDHLTQWWYDNMPTFLVGRSSRMQATFPNEEREFGLPTATLLGDIDVGAWLHEDGIRRGFDLAGSDDFRVDHSVLVPLHFLTPDLDVPVVPFFTNAIAPPFPTAERFYQLGVMIRAAIQACPLGRRVAILASGHLATEIGGPRHFAGSPDREFDLRRSRWCVPARSGNCRSGGQLRAAAAGRQRHPPVPQLRRRDGRRARQAGDGRRGRLLALRDVAVLCLDRGGAGMSRYAVNTFMRLVNIDPAALRDYVADPVGFASAWAEHDRPAASAPERTALEERDYATLYRLGAHPYLLWSFTEAVWVPEVSRPELVESFRAAAREVGYPDWRIHPAPTLQ